MNTLSLKQWYIIYGYGSLLASAICMTAIIVAAPFWGFKITIFSNSYGEGIIEAILLLFAAPAWGIIIIDFAQRGDAHNE